MNPTSLPRQLELSLEHLPTAFSKLAFLTAVRDPYTGKYLHEGWVSMGSPEEIHKLLRDSHHEVFEFVSGMPLMRLCGELFGYLRSISTPWKQTIRVWYELESYREMIPEGLCAEEREFFNSQMQAALHVIANAPDWAARELSSSRFPPPDQQLRRHWEN